MSGTQPKAANIANAVGIFAEVDLSRIETRHNQGWADVIKEDLADVFATAAEYVKKQASISIAYHGNIVDLLEYADEHNFPIDLLSDQTSCHNVYNGGYCPAGMTFRERTELLHSDRERFRQEVDKTLRRHYAVIRRLTATQVPLETMELGLTGLEYARQLAEGFNRNAASDLGVGAWQLLSCVEGAWLNVRIKETLNKSPSAGQRIFFPIHAE